jgi:putative restriction endonuclease
MGFGVFINRSDSIYDDRPAEKYQLPGQYLGRVQACVGDWIVYCEPRKVAATRGCFAVAKVERNIPDPKAPGIYLALIEHGSYLDFINPVPFSGPDGVIERGVLNQEGRVSDRAQAAVRPICATDFSRIVSFGIDEHEPELPRLDEPGVTHNCLHGPEAVGYKTNLATTFYIDRSIVISIGNRLGAPTSVLDRASQFSCH